MRVVMLDLYERNLSLPGDFPGDCCRAIPGMKVRRNCSRGYFEQRLHAPDGLPERTPGTLIFQVPDIGRGIKKTVPADDKGILEFSSHRKHRLRQVRPGCCRTPPALRTVLTVTLRDHKRERCITAGTADHVRLSIVKIHNRIVAADKDLPVVRKDDVCRSPELAQCLFVIAADRRSAHIAAGHHKAVRHRKTVIIPEQEQLNRRIRKHDAEFGVVRSCGFTDFSLALIKEKNRFLYAGENLFLLLRNEAFPLRRRKVPAHHGKRLCRPFFAPAKLFDCLCIRRIAAEMKTADSFHSSDAAIPDDLPRPEDRFPSPYIRLSREVHLRAAVIAADRLCIVSP